MVVAGEAQIRSVCSELLPCSRERESEGKSRAGDQLQTSRYPAVLLVSVSIELGS